MSLGKKIKELRSEREWTQLDLAEKSGLERGYIANLELDGIKNPSAYAFIKLAKAFKIKCEELYIASGILNDDGEIHLSRETHEEILEKLRLASPVSVPIYNDMPVYAGTPLQPVEYIYKDKKGLAKGKTEGYIVHGDCLEPLINDKDIVVVDTGMKPQNGDMVTCYCMQCDMQVVGKYQQINKHFWVINNSVRIKVENCYTIAVVTEIIRRIK